MENIVKRWEVPALYWLSDETRLGAEIFGGVLILLRTGKKLYSRITIPKPNGDNRNILIPRPVLCRVQTALNRRILSEIPAHPKAFGFSGGSITDAIYPHLRSKVLLSFDIKNAFLQIGYVSVLRSLLEGRKQTRIGRTLEYGRFSKGAANIICEISFWDSHLPQGAPTSPRLFDQALKVIDGRLFRLAKKVDGVFTRYADNIFFSLLHKIYIPPKVERSVLRVVGKRYWWHKRSVRRLNRGAVRMLGLNIIDGKITVPRDYKRNLRLGIHHIRYLLANKLPYEEAWLRLNGQMSHAFLGFLPDRLVINYEDLREEIEYLQSLDF